MKILAIESSCDETAAAVVENGVTVLTNVIATSAAMHAKYGGIVPEVAAREQLKVIIPTIKEATDKTDYNAIAVTVGPGLIGSLLVGVETAKTIAMVTRAPLIPVNHVFAHMYANFIGGTAIEFPAISLVVSGGHTELFLMTSPKDLQWLGGTLDDAAGEAFDKTARLLGFENRGGVAIQEAAKSPHRRSDEEAEIKLPRPLIHDGSLNFSFSGLKTAIWREWNKVTDIDEEVTSAFAYEVQEAITDVLVAKTKHAAQKYNAKSILLSGGVAANLRLRDKFMIHNSQFTIHFPPVSLCTDNAVYIASYAYFRGIPVDWHTITAIPDLSVEVGVGESATS
jgi:N6-L-threonylcarbamoyladenine synthase